MAKANTKRTSKTKLANKSANKRVKSKRRHKFETRKSGSKEVNLPFATTKNKKAKSQKPTSLEESDAQDNTLLNGDNSLDHDVEDMTDDDLKDFLEEHGASLSFLKSGSLEAIPEAKRKRKQGSQEEEYEKRPRKLPESFKDNDADNKIQLLPIKGKDGLIQRSKDKIESSVLEDEGAVCDSERNSDEVEEEQLPLIDICAGQQKKIQEQKFQIAEFSQSILESPEENVGYLKQLLDLCKRENAISIRKLSLLSLLEVFKDIVPSYRIRELTDEEKQAKVTKEVGKLRDFEESLLSNYRHYLQNLEEIINGCFKIKRKKVDRGKKVVCDVPRPVYTLGVLATKCLCDLLLSVPDFNFRNNIITVIVPRMEMCGQFQEVGEICLNTIKSVFRKDCIGDVSLEVVKIINRLSKSKGNRLKPQVIDSLMSLRISADLIRTSEERGNKVERLQKKKEAIQKMSRKERKRKKIEDKLDKELQEAEAVESKDKLSRLHAEILKNVFVTYFRVLKFGHRSALLSSVLRGLSKFAHLINVDFFDDLMSCLKDILSNEDMAVNDVLPCVLTGLKILSGQGESLNIDPRQFYTALYNAILQIPSGAIEELHHLEKECLENALIKRRKQISLPLTLAYFKRISTLVLQQDSNNIFGILSLVRNILQLHKKCEYLFDNESTGQGVFQPHLAEPEHCNAESSTSWEFCLAKSHFHPDVASYVRHILHGAPSQGSHALPVDMLRKHEVEVLDDPNGDNVQEYLPKFVPTAAIRQKKQIFGVNESTFRTRQMNECNDRTMRTLSDIRTEAITDLSNVFSR